MSMNDDRLAAYAIGALDPDEHAAFEQALADDPALRAALDEFRTVNDWLGRDVSPVAPSPERRDVLLASVQGASPFEGFVQRVSQFLDLGDELVRQLFARLHGGDEWEDGPIDAVHLMHFAGGPRVASADCGFVRIEAGTQFPHHSHKGDEWAFILQGRIVEPDGQEFGPGDISYRPEGSEHSIAAVGDTAAVFVVVLHNGLSLTRTRD